MEDDQGVLWYKGRICVPNVKELKDKILRETHGSAYSIHLGGNKMYHDLKATYWWYGMKRNVAKYVALCDTYQRVKAQYQRPARLLQPLQVPKWKWEDPKMMIPEQEAPKKLEVILPDEEAEPPQPRLFTMLMRDHEKSPSRMYDDLEDPTIASYDVDELFPKDGSRDHD
jgi:hypothetical protein